MLFPDPLLRRPSASVAYNSPNIDVLDGVFLALLSFSFSQQPVIIVMGWGLGGDGMVVVAHPLGLDYYLQFSKTDFSDENLKVRC